VLSTEKSAAVTDRNHQSANEDCRINSYAVRLTPLIVSVNQRFGQVCTTA